MTLLAHLIFVVGVASHPIETMKPLADNCILIAGTNDIHGHLEPHKIYRGEIYAKQGGIGALSAYIDALRRWTGGKLALLDGGDAYHGTYVSNAAHGRDVIKLMNLMRYDAMALGNHEFDFGATPEAPTDPRGYLKKRLFEAEFPILSANISRSDSSEINWPNLQSDTSIEVGNLKIGVIGVSTVETSYTTHPRNVVGLEFSDPLSQIIEKSAKLRSDGADVVVMAGHLGAMCKDFSDPLDISSCDTSEELIQLLNRLPQGTVDVALGGHTHKIIAHYFNGVATVESGSYARNLSLVRVCKDKERVETEVLPPLPLCLTTFFDGTCSAEGPETGIRTRYFLGERLKTPLDVRTIVDKALKEASKLSQTPMGIHLITPLTRRPHRNSPLGSTVAEAILASSGAELAIQNRGGVRSDLPRGVINHRQLYSVLPFANRITLMKISVADLRTMIDHMAKRRTNLLPYLAGHKVSRRNGRIEIFDGAEAMDDERILTVAVNDYLAAGGENLGEFFNARPSIEKTETDILLLDAVAGYLRGLSPSTLYRATR